MKLLIAFAAIAFTALAHVAKPIIPHNLELATDEFKHESHSFLGVVLHIGSGAEKRHDSLRFFLDLGLSRSLIPTKEHAEGVDCSSAEKNSCEFKPEPLTSKFYFNKELKVADAKAFLTLNENEIKIKDPEVQKLDFDLIVKGNSWWMKKWGVLGFAPKGDLSKYLAQIYDTPIPFLFSFAQSAPNSYSLRTFVNPLFTEAQVVKTFKIDEKAEYWSFTAEVSHINDEWTIPATEVCVNTLDQGIVQTEDAEDRCHALQKLVCDGKHGKQCTKSNSDFSKAPNLTLKVENKDFVFTPKEFLYIDNENLVKCRIGDIGNLRSAQTCGGRMMLGVGLGFMAKYPFVFELNYGQPTVIKVLSDFKEPSRFGLAFKALIVLGIAVFLIGGYLIYKTVWSKKPKTDNDYQSV